MANVIDKVALARNVRVARARLGISQKQLASKSGVCETTVSFIESAKDADVRPSTLIKLATALEVDVNDLLRE